jgi:hypothetical protein
MLEFLGIIVGLCLLFCLGWFVYSVRESAREARINEEWRAHEVQRCADTQARRFAEANADNKRDRDLKELRAALIAKKPI